MSKLNLRKIEEFKSLTESLILKIARERRYLMGLAIKLDDKVERIDKLLERHEAKVEGNVVFIKGQRHEL